MKPPILARGERAHPALFWIGVFAVSSGVLLHLPMYVRSATMNFHVAGMPIDGEMLLGMALIGSGTAAAFCGLLPAVLRRISPGLVQAEITDLAKAAPIKPDGKLNRQHWRLLTVLALALVIDSMKPARLGFTVPGTPRNTACRARSWRSFPFLALTGLTHRLLRLGRHRRPRGPARGDPAFGHHVRGHRDLRRHAGLHRQSHHVLLHGARGGRHAADHLYAAGGMHSQAGIAAGRLVLLGGLGLVGRFFRRERLRDALRALFRLAHHVVSQRAYRPHADPLQPAISRNRRAFCLRAAGSRKRAPWSSASASQSIPASGQITARGAVDSSAPPCCARLSEARRPRSISPHRMGPRQFRPFALASRRVARAAATVSLAPTCLLFRSAWSPCRRCSLVAWLYSRWSTKWTLCLLTVLTAFGLVGLSLIDAQCWRYSTTIPSSCSRC